MTASEITAWSVHMGVGSMLLPIRRPSLIATTIGTLSAKPSLSIWRALSSCWVESSLMIQTTGFP